LRAVRYLVEEYLIRVEKNLADLRTVLLTTLDDSLDMMTMSAHGD